MRKPKLKRDNWETDYMNNRTYLQFYNRLMEIAISSFEWKNLPKTVDPRFLELVLFGDGMSVFFKDDVLGYLALQTMIAGKLNVYRIPNDRRAYAQNGYNKKLDGRDSVIIFNNNLHTNSVLDIEMFAKRLYDVQRAIDVNVQAQKTPVLILADENQRMTMKNLYKQYQGNEPFIFGDKKLNPNDIKVLKTDAPYTADKLYELKTNIWNEALTYLGISNISINKKERLLTDEIQRNMGGTVASRFSRLYARKQACEQINEMFGLNIDVEFREDFNTDMIQELEGGDMYE